jgi:glycerol-3-phosphate dehydrogenase (NAD(P)+)
MADEATPVFNIQRMYLKDLSLEQPNSPQILLEQQQPQVDINLGVGAEQVADGIFEVTVTATVTTKVKDKVLFLVEAKQAGIFEIRNVPAGPDAGHHQHRLPADDLPLPARHRLRPLHARRLPADPADRSELPGHVRGAAGAAGRAGQRLAHHHRRQLKARRARPAAALWAPCRAHEDRDVLGAGAWGTALAVAAAARHEVLLWARDPAQAAAMLQRALQPPLPARGGAAARPAGRRPQARSHARLAGLLIVIATPMAGCAACCRRLPAGQPAVWLCKGFEAGTACWATRSRAPPTCGRACPACVLSGPSFALEVARGQPTALVAASERAALAEAVEALHGDGLRVYTSADIVGVEVGGAVKNVLAIATGMLDGMAATRRAPGAPGLNARAALITRGLAEMTRLGVALGARADTFMGLSGLGDLVLTATGDLSRNRKVGLLLAQGRAGRGAGRGWAMWPKVSTRRARRPTAPRSLGVDMPITQAVVDVLEGRLQPREAMAR